MAVELSAPDAATTNSANKFRYDIRNGRRFQEAYQRSLQSDWTPGFWERQRIYVLDYMDSKRRRPDLGEEVVEEVAEAGCEGCTEGCLEKFVPEVIGAIFKGH